ncbi:copper homeostasis protein CutC [Vibrio sp. 10N.261.55.A7]|uniref:copper homeostasis protein CutC n=1 Tax=Vibrio sp. 10N.261.55.A7 TaxID=1880851 RepID=UPI000C84CD78|nr:copper homeostasis protein CutC [Vibrio sp. 10N.261.55.A7]PMJ90159.1 copper homeostasis protein CutC [Vibrio sp. 10N.261.55.A7]
MNYHIEVCIDNLESLHNAIEGGATRIELCSSLALGGLTPSFGMMKKAAQISPIPVYAMIRPRQGDFLYDADDIESMLIDIEAASLAGLNGVVFGLLDANGNIDMTAARQLAEKAHSLNLGITFHRAIDQCQDYQTAIEQVCELGCERVLTSGLASTAEKGISVIADMVNIANGRIGIMAGAGLNVSNVQGIVEQTHISEVHLSGKSSRASKMTYVAEQAKMGNSDDFIVPVTDAQAISLVTALLD